MPVSSLENRIPGEAKHQPELDGIRGIAILLVLASHAAGMLGVLPHLQPHSKYVSIVAFVLVPGWCGVDLFFVLSGFLITSILLRTREKPRYFQSFYARRALRIFPIYYLVLLGSITLAHFVPAVQSYLPPPGIQREVYFFYLQNMPCFWVNRTAVATVWGIYWSLAVEEQFYLVWPMLVRYLTRTVMLWICVIAFVLELPVRLVTMHFYFGVHFGAIMFTLNRADGLFVGAAIALYMDIKRRTVPMRWIAAAGAVSTAIFLYVVAFHPHDLVGDGRLYTIGITAFALGGGALVALSQHHPARLQQWLTVPLLRSAGKYSYGMYVYHLILFYGIHSVMRRLSAATDGELKLLPALGVMLLSIMLVWLVAKLSFDLFEQRFLRLKKWFPASGAAESRR